MTVPAGPDAGRDNEYEALLTAGAEAAHTDDYPTTNHCGWECCSLSDYKRQVKPITDATLAAVADLIQRQAVQYEVESRDRHFRNEIDFTALTMARVRSEHEQNVAARLRGLGR